MKKVLIAILAAGLFVGCNTIKDEKAKAACPKAKVVACPKAKVVACPKAKVVACSKSKVVACSKSKAAAPACAK